MSGRSARTRRRYSVELWQDLVLLDVRKSTFQHLTVDWNLNVLEMSSKPSILSRSLQDTFIIYSSILQQHMFRHYSAKRKISRIGNLKIQKPRFTNRSPVRSLLEIRRATGPTACEIVSNLVLVPNSLLFLQLSFS